MAKIPVRVATRGLETGNVVQYPSSNPIANAFANMGDTLSDVAAYQQKKQLQKDEFEATLRENELSAEIGRLEDEAVQKAPADASGIHDTVYGQIDPQTNTATKPGTFDVLFDSYLSRVPESKRQEFQQKKELYRLRGSSRMAEVQYKSEQAYYKVEIQKTQNDITTAMAMADPNDDQTFEQFKKQGLDIIDKSPLPALEKDVARTNWLANADETLFKTKLEKDPSFAQNARAALGLAPAATTSGNIVDKIVGVESGGNATAKNPNSSATGAGQFISSTWMATVKKHRPDLLEGRSTAEVLALRNNGELSREMTGYLTQDNAEFLRNQGIQTTDGNLYLAHFLGPRGAAQVSKASPDASVASVVGQDVVNANPFLKGMTASDVVAWANKKMGGSGSNSAPDPRFTNIPLSRRLVLANQADVQVAEVERIKLATQKADYTNYKDSVELQVVQGKIRDENIISADGTLNDGDKATLIRSVRTQNETLGQVQADLSALTSEALALDPYASKDKMRADNLYSAAAKDLPPEQGAAIASAIIQQTGVVPQPVLNNIRRGLSSTSIPDVVAAAQSAVRISSFDPAVLGRRDGGGEVQKTADDFSYYVNTLNMTPEAAAQRIIDGRDPQKQRDRKALEPAAKEFIKSIEGENIANTFDESILPFTDPEVGVNPGQEAGIKAEYVAIAEEQFYAANGDPEIAKNRANEEMKRLYGVSELGGAKTIMKHPPEKYWPKQANAGGFLGIGADPFQYARTQIYQDIYGIAGDEFDASSIRFIATPETDAMIKRGEMPAYSVLYKDANGVLQTIPGKLWRPDTSSGLFKATEEKAAEEQVDTIDRARNVQSDDRVRAETQALPDGGRERSLDAFLAGPPQIPAPGRETIQNRLDERRDELFENAPNGGGGGF